MASIATTQSPSSIRPEYNRSRAPASDKSLLSTLNLGFLKNFTEKKETRDGQPAKRRGPKPNSKPALTRRQELNRQAQRTHRERKELYIKALEDEVLRLKEFYSAVTKDRDRLAEENQHLRALLTQNGMSLPSPVGSGLTTHHPTEMQTPIGSSPIRDRSVGPYTESSGLSATGSHWGGGGGVSSSHTSALTPPSQPVTGPQLISPQPGDISQFPVQVQQSPPPHQQQLLLQQQQQQQQQQHEGYKQAPLSAGGMSIQDQPHMMGRNANIDYDQAGVDFVLTLENPCMEHLPWLLERSTEVGGRELCGHALMASSLDPIPCPAGDAPLYMKHGVTKSGNNATNAILGNSAVSSHRSVLHRRQKPQQQTQQQRTHQHGGSKGHVDTIMADTDTLCQQPKLTKADLSTLLILSQRLNLDGEITPVMAWGMVLAHPRLADLQMEDFERLAEELRSKVRCYGFGAVMEEFEVRDALESIFSTKPEFKYEFGRAF